MRTRSGIVSLGEPLMKNCPLCDNDLGEAEIVCSACVGRIILHEPKRRETRIRQVADTLVIFLAVFLFLKGAFAMWEQGGYANFVQSLGFPIGSEGLHYLNASVCILAALGYAVTALGNYLAKPWTLRLCMATFAFFLVTQTILQLADTHENYSFSQALAVVFFLTAVPALQLVMAFLGAGKAGMPLPEQNVNQ